MKKCVIKSYHNKPKTLGVVVLGILNCLALSSCNNNNIGGSTNTPKGVVQGQTVKYDNDQVNGVWASVDGYDGHQINPTINILAQNNTDTIVSFVGCEKVQGNRSVEYNLKAFRNLCTFKPLNIVQL